MHDERQFADYDRMARIQKMYYDAHRPRRSGGLKILDLADFNPYEQSAEDNSVDPTYTGRFETREEYDDHKEAEFFHPAGR